MRIIYFLVAVNLLGWTRTAPADEVQVRPDVPATASMATGDNLSLPSDSRVNAKDFGVVGDGTTDDTATLQAALDAATTKGPICFLPAGQYRLNGSLTVPPGVTLLGASGGVPHSEHPIGTVLLAYGGKGKADGPPLVTLKPNAVIRNLTIHYPEQTLPDVVPYPWTIRGDGELCQVLDVTMTNPYQALDFGTCWNELHLIRNVFACPLKTGVYIDQCTDIGRIENVHFNPNFWTRMKLKPGFPQGRHQGLPGEEPRGLQDRQDGLGVHLQLLRDLPVDRIPLRRLRPRAGQRGGHAVGGRHLHDGRPRRPHPAARGRPVRQRAVHVHVRRRRARTRGR